MKATRCTAVSAIATMILAVAVVQAQQDVPARSSLEALASWTVLDVPTGYETRFAGDLAAQMPGWSADVWGNVVARSGTGGPRRLVACALDRPAYAVSQITADGYLRVHRIGRGSRHPLWDQAFEAQPVRVLTQAGPVAGVVARTNAHFAQQHRHETAVVTADGLWVDVGADSRAEVSELGIELLDPVTRHLAPWTFADQIAGPDAGRRVGCGVVAAVAAAAAAGGGTGETIFVLGAQEGMGWVGLSSIVAREPEFDEVIIVGPGEAAPRVSSVAVATLGRMGGVLAARGLSQVTVMAPAVRQPASHVESVAMAEAESLLQAVSAAIGIVARATPEWIRAPAPAPFLTPLADATMQPLAAMLDDLVEVYGVSGHEDAVAQAVLNLLPDWAREIAAVDELGNVVVEAGPRGPASVFVAHLDEVGFEVESIAEDGVTTLRGGGSSAWEGQAALLHFDAGAGPAISPPLRGVFLTRDAAERRQPETLAAWFGLDAVALKARGVGPGMAVSGHKEGLRLGRYRYLARSLDDRAGTAALLTALRAIDPTALPGRVIFAWSVREETGLDGAAALAARFGPSTRRVYSVDTFVSSDTPLESPHFAYAPLGDGPVLRAIENSSVSPETERARVRAVARQAGVSLQIGLTQGGTDGTMFTFWGAPNQGLSWPGRYSHSPGEVLDLRDLASLARLIGALATAGG